MKVILALALAVGVVFWWLKAGRGSGPESGRRGVSSRTRGTGTSFRYRAVSVCAGAPACEAVRQLEGSRFLQESVPSLPLPQCDQQRCRCTYRHHEDRREADNRRAEHGLDPSLASPPPGPEMRRSKGRRRVDYED